MISLTVIGKGNVGTHLYNRFLEIDAVDSKWIDSRNLNSIEETDITILAVSDDAISDVSSQIENSFVVHTSGSVSMDQLQNKARKGIFYPLQSFTKGEIVDFTKIPFCVEAENTNDLKLLEQLVELLGTKSYQISSEQRKKIHLAAVFANNFTNHMYKISKDICDSNQIPFEILLPLIEETASKIKNISPGEAQTGPALRNDQKTIQKHLEMLNQQQKELYTKITESIQKHGKKL